jgi:hypothetical protein
MEQWTEYFPPLNLWNYSVSWSWHNNEELESFFDVITIGETSDEVCR